jgi:hypothetical protein
VAGSVRSRDRYIGFVCLEVRSAPAGSADLDAIVGNIWTGRIIDDGSSSGSGKPGKRVAPTANVRIESDDGSETLTIGHRPSSGPTAGTTILLAGIDYCEFGVCPICIEEDRTSREHEPQSALGGQVRTLTCRRCNNLPRSRVEADLTDWCFKTWRNARVSNPKVLGRRRIPQLHVRQDGAGQFVLVPNGPVDPVVREMLAARLIQFEGHPPNPRRYRLAALKTRIPGRLSSPARDSHQRPCAADSRRPARSPRCNQTRRATRQCHSQLGRHGTQLRHATRAAAGVDEYAQPRFERLLRGVDFAGWDDGRPMGARPVAGLRSLWARSAIDRSG